MAKAKFCPEGSHEEKKYPHPFKSTLFFHRGNVRSFLADENHLKLKSRKVMTGCAGFVNRLRRLCGEVAQAMWSGCAGYVQPRVDIESLVATKKFLNLVPGSFSLLQFSAQVIYFLSTQCT